MLIYPAVDILDGKAVRLTRGEYDRVKVYFDSPEAAAESFLAAGARRLHVVDLNGARQGRPVHLREIRALCRLPMEVEVGGGIREEASIEAVLEAGAARVILGTAAWQNPGLPQWLAHWGGQLAVGVDARDGRVALRGWLEDTGSDALDFCIRLREMGCKRVIYTDIARDGGLAGPNLSVYRRLTELDGLEIVASGGVSGYADIRALADIGCTGVIVGKALYEARVSMDILAKMEEI
ncbi:MAG: 1-(5-phosphoribosyl)-5-[(5-phosphoribosylamino)methylideneamino]imidazole-4-carboxamide isomerase [Christensenellales bacterium]|jgi:phosphoribosylformimino-5-aminoimidazole carboxamide ribotide isomerase